MDVSPEVLEEAKRLYALSRQGEWEDLSPALQELWIREVAK